MTCIVGLIQNGHVYLGGDAATVSGSHLVINRDAKVFRCGKDESQMLLGTSGSPRLRNLLLYLLTLPVYSGSDPMAYMVAQFVPALRTCLREEGFLQEEDGQSILDGAILVGFQRELFLVGSRFNVTRTAHGYMAIGSGEEYAYGSLQTTSLLQEKFQLSPQRRAELALLAAEAHSTDVAQPFMIISTEAEE